jgi:hypothetical protein
MEGVDVLLAAVAVLGGAGLFGLLGAFMRRGKTTSDAVEGLDLVNAVYERAAALEEREAERAVEDAVEARDEVEAAAAAPDRLDRLAELGNRRGRS